MTEITDLSETDSANTEISTYSVDGNIANMSSTDNVFQAVLGLLKRSLKSSIWRLRDSTDQTKLLAFDLSGLTTTTTRTQIVPDENGRQALQPHLAGRISGLTLSNNATDVVNDIDVAAGVAIDGTNSHVITLASALSKRLDAAWVVGSGNGGLDTGSIANTTYHLWLIKRPDTGVVDVLFSASATSPTMPASYTLKRRIGSVLRESGAIVLFKQVGNRFRRTPILNVDVSNPGATAVTRTLGVPTGIVVVALFAGHVIDTTSSGSTAALFSALNENDTLPVSGGIGHTLTVNASGASSASVFTGLAIPTNTSGQIRSRFSASDADVYLRMFTEGWIDEDIRG